MSLRTGVTFPFGSLDLRASCALAREAEALGFTDGWTAEINGTDGLAAATAVGLATETMRIGCAVVPAFTRPPALIAMGALAAHQASEGRFCLGIGASSPLIVGEWMGLHYERPVARVRETIAVLKQSFSGAKTDIEGSTLRSRGFRLDQPADIPLFLAALGPKMLELANREADGVALFLTGEEGVRIARRAAPEREILARLICVPDAPEEAVFPLARRQLAPYIAVEGYNRFIAAQGFEDDAQRVADAWRTGDRAAACEAISDDLVRSLVLAGSAGSIKERLASLADAGLDTAILWVQGPGTIEDGRRILKGLAPAS